MVKIYIAGPEILVNKPDLLKLHPYNLYSWHLARKAVLRDPVDGRSIFIDSGAYSAFKKNLTINLFDYMNYLNEHKDKFALYSNLDVIGDAKKTFKNQKIMEENGLAPMPVFHLNEDFKYLKYYIDNYDYIALGGVAFNRSESRMTIEHLDKCFQMLCGNDGSPIRKVHGFGITSIPTILRYPWYSLDSTSWLINTYLGLGLFPIIKKQGHDFYQLNRIKLTFVASKSQKDSFYGLPEATKKAYIEYIHSLGLRIGQSAFRNGKEKIVRKGVCNWRPDRWALNIHFFKNLQEQINKSDTTFLQNKIPSLNL